MCLSVFLNEVAEALMPGVVACTYNPATTEAEYRNDVGAVPVGGNSPSTGRLSNQLYVISARRKI